MPKVSVVIPTCNRHDLLPQAIKSVLNQTYQDFEIIVVDDGDKKAENIVKAINNDRIKYINNGIRRGGSAARDTGIKNSQGKFIAFLDDDDEWLPEKLEVQMNRFEKTPDEVGFCFCAIQSISSDTKKENSQVPDGIDNYHELALRSFNGFLTITLIVKKFVFDSVGFFDERLPSHQEPDLIIRITKKFKGLGINQPLSLLNVRPDHDQIGKNLNNRIRGREILLEKHSDEYKTRPLILAKLYFQLGIYCRDNHEYAKSRKYFLNAWKMNKKGFRSIAHYILNLIKQ